MGAALSGSGDMAFGTMTNWSKARLFGVDFSSAIVADGDGDDAGNNDGKKEIISFRRFARGERAYALLQLDTRAHQ